MTSEARPQLAHVIPPAAAAEWVALEVELEEVGPVPCRVSPVPDAWWSTSPELVDQAVAGCMGCPVLEQCLAYSVAARERFGIWGGRTPLERGFGPAGGRRGGERAGAA